MYTYNMYDGDDNDAVQYYALTYASSSCNEISII